MVDTPMGYIKIPILSIAKECERDAKPVDTILPLTDGGGDVHVELDWVPLDSNLTTVRHITSIPTQLVSKHLSLASIIGRNALSSPSSNVAAWESVCSAAMGRWDQKCGILWTE